MLGYCVAGTAAFLLGLVVGYAWGFWAGYDDGHQAASYALWRGWRSRR